MPVISNDYKIPTKDPQMPEDSLIFKISRGDGTFKYVGMTKKVFHETMFNIQDGVGMPYKVNNGVSIDNRTETMIDEVKGFQEFYYKWEYDVTSQMGIWLKVTDQNLSDIRDEIIDFLYNGESLPTGGYMQWLYVLQTSDTTFTHSNILQNFKTSTGLSSFSEFTEEYNNAFINNVYNLNLICNYYNSKGIVDNLIIVSSLPQIDTYYYFENETTNLIGIKSYLAGDNMVDIHDLLDISAVVDGSYVDSTSSLLPTFKYQLNVKNNVFLDYLNDNYPEWCYEMKPSNDTIWSYGKRYHTDYYYFPEITPDSTLKFDVRIYSNITASTPIIYMVDIFEELNVNIIT
jgi:hypothetical protein